MTSNASLTRRRFLRQTLTWSALAAGAHQGSAFALQPAKDDAAHALILGDWGYQDKLSSQQFGGDASFVAQAQVAHGMRHFAQSNRLNVDALFLLGDSFYGDLPDGVASKRWRTQFESLYPAEAFPGPAYSMFGNHDYQYLPATVNKVDAELEYARIGKGLDGKPTRWTIPARWYTFDFPKHKPVMRCIVLDSNMPAADGRARHNENFYLTPEQQAEQLQWFKQQLQRPRDLPFLTVMAHHPIYSNGPHGDHAVLIRDWAPLLREHKVDLYMAGHDHDLQALQFEGEPTTHFLSGGGGADLYILQKEGLDRGPYAQEVHGFSALSVTANELQMRHLDASGRFLFGLTRDRSGKVRELTS
jgi:tartrate-resistant acid phosphatase type 5